MNTIVPPSLPVPQNIVSTVSHPLQESPPPLLAQNYAPQLEDLSPVFPDRPIVKRRESIASRMTRYSRNVTEKVANFQRQNPMLSMVLIALLVALIAPQLIPFLL